MDTEATILDDAAKASRFILAGNATFTVVSKKTGTRFTYKVRASEDGGVFFASLLRGSDNESDFTFIGTIRAETRAYRHGSRSQVSADAPGAKAFAWFWSRLAAGHLPETAEVYHEGRCGRCGRKLTVPDSILTGLGPECAQAA